MSKNQQVSPPANGDDTQLTQAEIFQALAQAKKDKRAAQSRLNGAKSQGPITPEGKAISSKNSLVHGHAAKVNVLIQHDDPHVYDAHLAGYHSSFRPTDYFESELVDELAAASWKRARLSATLTTLIDFQLSVQQEKLDQNFPLEADDSNLHLAFAWQALARQPFPRELPISPLDPIDPTIPPEQLDVSSLELVRRYMMLHDRQFRSALNNLRQYRKDFKTPQEAPAPASATVSASVEPPAPQQTAEPAQKSECQPATTQNPPKPNEPTTIALINRPKPAISPVRTADRTEGPPQEAATTPEVAA